MLISIKKAVKRMRERTGLSISTSTRKVKGLIQIQDGKLFKVHESDVEAEIVKILTPPIASGTSILSPKQRQKLRDRTIWQPSKAI